MDLAPHAKRLRQGRGFLGRGDAAADERVDAHDVPRASREVVGRLLEGTRVHLARRDSDVQRVGKRLVRGDVRVAQRHLEPFVAELVELAPDAERVVQAVRTDRVDHQREARPDLLPDRGAQFDVAIGVAPDVQLDGPES